MNLTTIQYDAIMEAIQQAKNAIECDEFIDPFGDIPDGYTNETLRKALDEVEKMIVRDNLPF